MTDPKVIHLHTMQREVTPPGPEEEGFLRTRDEHVSELFRDMIAAGPSFGGRSVYVSESYYAPERDAHRLVLHHFYDGRDESPIYPGLDDHLNGLSRASSIAAELKAATPPPGGEPAPGLAAAYAKLDAATMPDNPHLDVVSYRRDVDVEYGRRQRDLDLIREAAAALTSPDGNGRIEVAGVPFMPIDPTDVLDRAEQILRDAGIEPPRVIAPAPIDLKAVCLECETVIAGKRVGEITSDYWAHVEDIGPTRGHLPKPIVGTVAHAEESDR